MACFSVVHVHVGALNSKGSGKGQEEQPSIESDAGLQGLCTETKSKKKQLDAKTADISTDVARKCPKKAQVGTPLFFRYDYDVFFCVLHTTANRV